MNADIRSETIALPPALERFARSRTTDALARFAEHLESVVVHIEDRDDLRGGFDKACRIQARGPDVDLDVEHRHVDPYFALGAALSRMSRVIASHVDGQPIVRLDAAS